MEERCNNKESNSYPEEEQIQMSKEALKLFGKMRDATKEEEREITNNILKQSVPTGINFWDDL